MPLNTKAFDNYPISIFNNNTIYLQINLSDLMIQIFVNNILFSELICLNQVKSVFLNVNPSICILGGIHLLYC